MLHAAFLGGPLDGLQLPVEDPTLQISVRRTRPWHLYRCVRTPVHVAMRMMSVTVSEKYIEEQMVAQGSGDIQYTYVRDLTHAETAAIRQALRLRKKQTSEPETQER